MILVCISQSILVPESEEDFTKLLTVLNDAVIGSERVMLGIPKRQKEKKGTLAFRKVVTCPQGRVPLSCRVFAQF